MRFRNAILFVALAIAWGSAFTAITARRSSSRPFCSRRFATMSPVY